MKMVCETIRRFGGIINTNTKSFRKWSRKILPILMLYLIGCIYWNTCSSSVSNIYSLTTNAGSFNGYSTFYVYQVVAGPVSLNLYYLYYYSSNTVIRRIGTDDALQWMAAMTFEGYGRRMIFDSTEQNLYIADLSNPLHVVKFQTSDGVIVDALTL